MAVSTTARARSSIAAASKLGSHRGHHNFTVGQRRGIGIGAPEPFFVLATDAVTNTVTVGAAADLEVSTVRVRDAILHRPRRPRRRGQAALPLQAAEVRDHHRRWTRAGPGRHADLRLELDHPARAAAPGQTAAFCDGDVVVGHGTIA